MQDQIDSETHPNPEQQQWIWGLDDHHSNMAARTTTDPAILETMVEDVLSGKIPNDYSVSEELMGNENLPFDAAAKLARAWDSEVDLYHQVLERDDATPEVLDAWADADNPVAISIIANHPNTKAQTLVKLTKHQHPLAPFWVIITRRLPQDVVDSFASSAEVRVRVAVAAVSNNQETLKKLATDPADEVRLAVATNPHSAATIISELARAEEHPNLQMGRVLGQRLDDPELLGKLAAHSEPRVRLAVAQNPHTSAGTLNELARKEERPCPGMCKALRKRLDQPDARLRQRYPVLRPAQFLSRSAAFLDHWQAREDRTETPPTQRLQERVITALDGLNGLFLDWLFRGVTDFAARYRLLDGFDLSRQLWQHWLNRFPEMRPGDEFDILDHFAAILGLSGTFIWVPGPSKPSGALPASPDNAPSS